MSSKKSRAAESEILQMTEAPEGPAEQATAVAEPEESSILITQVAMDEINALGDESPLAEAEADATGTNLAASRVDPPVDTHDGETLAEIIRLNSTVSEARAKLDRVTIKHKAAKEELAECQDALNQFVSELGREYPLFDGVTADGEIRSANGTPKPEEATAPPDSDDKLARMEPIGRLADHGLSVAIISKLLEAGIPSIGALADWTAPPPGGQGKGLNELVGIGFTKAEKINAALDAFWIARRGGPVDVDAVLTEGCKEVEAGKADISKLDPAWRSRPVENLGLSNRIVTLLLGGGIEIAEGVASFAAKGPVSGDMDLMAADLNEIDDALHRFRNSLSNAQIWDYEAFMEQAGAEQGEEAEGGN